MRQIREILRLRLGLKLTQREVGLATNVSPATVWDVVTRMQAAGFTWPLDPGLDDMALEARLYPSLAPEPGGLTRPDLAYIHRELRRKGVTLMLLWQEYKLAHRDDGYGYSRFCGLYEDFAKKLDVVMRQVHQAGEKVFVDWSGDGITITDPQTGEERKAELFVAVLGACECIRVEPPFDCQEGAAQPAHAVDATDAQAVRWAGR